jgi:hypothetical protein
MYSRCHRPKSRDYQRYGAIGITVYVEWHDFINFLRDMGERPEGKTIDRINGKGNYEPGNCRWATAKEQANNIKTNRIITFKGETKTLPQWAEQYGIYREVIRKRLKAGWSVERALLTPNRSKTT